MPGPKGVFKSVGKKLKKLLKPKSRNRRQHRQAGLPGGPGGGHGGQQPQPQGQQGQQPPQGWVGGQHQGGRVGELIGHNRGPRGWVDGRGQGPQGTLQIGSRPGQQGEQPTTEPEQPTTEPQPNPYVLAPNPYVQNPYVTAQSPYAQTEVQAPGETTDDPYAKKESQGTPNPYSTGSPYATKELSSVVSGSNSPISDSTQSSQSAQQTTSKTEGDHGEQSPKTSTVAQGQTSKTEQPSPYEPVVHLDSNAPDNKASTVSSVISSGTESSDLARQKARNDAEELDRKVKKEVDARIVALKKKKKSKQEKKRDEEREQQRSKAPNVYGTSPYNPYGSGNVESEEVPLISESSIETDKMEVTPDELIVIQAQVKRELNAGSPDVQRVFDGGKVTEPVSLMMRQMRDNSQHTVDTPEVVAGKSYDVKRTELSPNEQESKGWALTALRDMYVTQDAYKGKDGLFNTKYLFEETTSLEGATRALGSEQVHGREKTVIRYKEGKWVDADDQVIDTSGAREMQFAITMRTEALRAKLAEAELAIKGQENQQVIETLGQRIVALTEKLKRPNLEKHKSVTGKYIYVMNSAGQLFAGKAQQWVIHHSSFLAGGAVASAGEVGISGGTLDYISNQSGHYRPGPVYLWQAVKQLDLDGCPLESVTVHVMGVKSKFKSAKAFLTSMDPTADPKLFDAAYAINHLDGVVAGLKQQKDVA